MCKINIFVPFSGTVNSYFPIFWTLSTTWCPVKVMLPKLLKRMLPNGLDHIQCIPDNLTLAYSHLPDNLHHGSELSALLSTLNCPFNSHVWLISKNFPRICSANYPGSTVLFSTAQDIYHQHGLICLDFWLRAELYNSFLQIIFSLSYSFVNCLTNDVAQLQVT